MARLITIGIIVTSFGLTFYACKNISAQDFGLDDMANIMDVVLNKEDYIGDIIKTEDYTENPENTASIGDTQVSAETSEVPETSYIESESETNTTATTEAPTNPPETTTDENKSGNWHYGTGDETVDIKSVFPNAPEKFWDIDYPASVPMIDSLKKNIKELAGFSPRDFGGISFSVATTDARLFTPKYGGGTLSDARRYRTELVEAECGILIDVPETLLEKSNDQVLSYIRTAARADLVGDVLCLPFDIQSELIKDGLLMNMKKTPFLNINAEYFNFSATKSYTVNGNIFALVSDLTFDPSTIYAVFYNKSLIKEYDLTNPLQLYKNGKWDYDGMFSVAKEFTAVVADLNDVVGTVYSLGIDRDDNDIINGLFIGSGETYFSESESESGGNYPVLDFGGDKTLKFIEDLRKMISLPSGEASKFMNPGSQVQSNAFKNGDILFSLSKLDMIPSISDSDFNWGILPVPTLIQNGKIYSFTDKNAMSISILKGARNTEACGIAISALSAFSHNQLKDIYVDEQMTFYLRDVDSVIALKNIVNSLTFNRYNAYSTMPEIYSSTVGLIKDAANDKGDFAILYESRKKIADDFFRGKDSPFFVKK